MNTQLLELLSHGEDRVTVQVSGEDLLKFADAIISQSNAKSLREREENTQAKLLPKKEVCSILGVCDTTLWKWAKSKYLVPVKAGKKILYRKADIEKLLQNSNVKK